MKNFVLINIVVALTLSGCKFLPVAHDPALAQSYVTTKIAIDNAECTNKTGFAEAIKEATWMKTYAEFRKDPQVESTAGIVDTLGKAHASSEKVCEHWVKLSKQRLEVLNKAWSGR